MGRESESLVEKMGDMFHNMESLTHRSSGRRTSLGGDQDSNNNYNNSDFGINNKFLRTGPVEMIREVEEDEGNERDERNSVFSMIVKDDVTKAKDKMAEYVLIIQEMADEIENLDLENQRLEEAIDSASTELENQRERVKELLQDLDETNKKNIVILQKMEKSYTEQEHLEMLLEDQKKLTKQKANLTGRMGEEEEQLMMQENENLMEQNLQLQNKLGFLEERLQGKEKEHDMACSNIDSLANSKHKVLLELAEISGERDQYMTKLEKLKAEIACEREERGDREELLEIELQAEIERLSKENRELESQVCHLATKNLQLNKEIEFMRDSFRNENSVLMINDHSRTYVMDMSMQNNNTFLQNNNHNQSRILDMSGLNRTTNFGNE